MLKPGEHLSHCRGETNHFRPSRYISLKVGLLNTTKTTFQVIHKKSPWQERERQKKNTRKAHTEWKMAEWIIEKHLCWAVIFSALNFVCVCVCRIFADFWELWKCFVLNGNIKKNSLKNYYCCCCWWCCCVVCALPFCDFIHAYALVLISIVQNNSSKNQISNAEFFPLVHFCFCFYYRLFFC